MARIKKGRKEKKRKKKNTIKTHISHSCGESLNDAILTKFGTGLISLTWWPLHILVAIDWRVGTLWLYKIYLFPMTSIVGITTGKHWRAAVIILFCLFILSYAYSPCSRELIFHAKHLKRCGLLCPRASSVFRIGGDHIPQKPLRSPPEGKSRPKWRSRITWKRFDMGKTC